MPHIYPLILATHGHAAIDSDVFNNALKGAKDFIMTLNTQLQGGKRNLVGGRVTVADITVAVQLIPLYQTVLDGGFRKATGNVSGWLEAFIKHPEVVSRIGNVKFAAKTIKPTLAEKKKEEVKAPAPAPVKKAEKTEDDDSVEKKVSGKNRLDNLPPTNYFLR
jgi:elongation factor 1-gamma